MPITGLKAYYPDQRIVVDPSGCIYNYRTGKKVYTRNFQGRVVVSILYMDKFINVDAVDVVYVARRGLDSIPLFHKVIPIDGDYTNTTPENLKLVGISDYDEEKWVKPDFLGGLYMVSEKGKVISIKGHINAWNTSRRNGTPAVRLCVQGESDTHMVKRLVYRAFVDDNIDKLRLYMIDGDELNCHYSNIGIKGVTAHG